MGQAPISDGQCGLPPALSPVDGSRTLAKVECPRCCFSNDPPVHPTRYDQPRHTVNRPLGISRERQPRRIADARATRAPTRSTRFDGARSCEHAPSTCAPAGTVLEEHLLDRGGAGQVIRELRLDELEPDGMKLIEDRGSPGAPASARVNASLRIVARR